MAGDVAEADWGVSTSKGKKTYLHVLEQDAKTISCALSVKPKRVIDFASRQPLSFHYDKKTKTLTPHIGSHRNVVDYIIEIEK